MISIAEKTASKALETKDRNGWKQDQTQQLQVLQDSRILGTLCARGNTFETRLETTQKFSRHLEALRHPDRKKLRFHFQALRGGKKRLPKQLLQQDLWIETASTGREAAIEVTVETKSQNFPTPRRGSFQTFRRQPSLSRRGIEAFRSGARM